jgi:hypothetical protein
VIDWEQMFSIEPHKNVPIIRVIFVLLNATAKHCRSIAIVPEAFKPVLLNQVEAHFSSLRMKLSESHEQHIKWKFANLINWLLMSGHFQGGESFELIRAFRSPIIQLLD